MEHWLRQHSWSLVIALIAVVSSYAVYGYRITALEQQAKVTTEAIATLNSSSVALQIALAKIQTDIEYIKVQVTK